MNNTLSIYKLITKLSSRDFKKNIQYNIYYLITIIVFSAIMYSLNALTAKKYIIRQIPYYDVDNILLFTRIGAVFFLILAIGIIIYINKYLFNNQKDKYYLLRTMGVSKKIISYKIFFEQFICTIIGGIIGIAIGSIFSFFITAYVLKIMEISINNSFTIYGDSFLITAIELFGVLCFTYLKNIRRFKGINIKSLLKVEKKMSNQRQKPLIFKIIILGGIIIATLCCTIYYSQIQHFKDIPENIKNIFLIIMIFLLVLALRCITGLLIDVKIKKRKSNDYKNERELLYLTELTAYAKRMKYMLFASCIILLSSILIPIMSSIFQTWSERFNQYKGNLDIEINSVYNSISNAEDIPEIDPEYISKYLLEQNIKIDKMVKIENYLAEPNLFMNRKRGTFPPYVISLSEYNQARIMSGLSKVDLQEGEFLVHKHKTEQKSYESEIVLSNGIVLQNSGQEYTESVGGESIFNNDNNYVIVVNDDQINGLLKVSETLLINTDIRLDYEKASHLEDDIVQALNEYNQEEYVINNTGDEYYTLFEINMGTISDNQYVTFTILLRLLSLYLFVIGMILTLSILSLNYLFIMGERLQNVRICKRIGITAKENNYIRRKETIYIYATPLILAGISTIFVLGGYIFMNYNELNVFVSIPVIILNMCQYFLIVLLMTCIYALITEKSIKTREEKEYAKY